MTKILHINARRRLRREVRFHDSKPSERFVKLVLSKFVRNVIVLGINDENEQAYYQYSFKDSPRLESNKLLSELNNITGVEGLDISFNLRSV